ncbi:hypothetical protein BKA62DRAFT_682187 [Auriculariales sp. MPI-PUGE-AT-0066]|nr:hypothetical protein BKA62DRAFT_682187 [Auriculariales sp. MPI-PUGE-AT-0066]
MASLRERLLSVVGFRVLPTTIVVCVVYTVIFFAALVYPELQSEPSRSKVAKADVNFNSAWSDLQVISTFPHPFNSHYNDIVGQHILGRLEQITAQYPHARVEYDNKTSATFPAPWSGSFVTHYEATNILVHVLGRSPELDSVLVSAHYDSVSTAPGTTDDGMGVASLIALVDYFAQHQPLRTIVFNCNNGEEDGLNGAKIFMLHPWAGLPKAFVNLEGAGAGGRPMLFRTSSTAVTKAFRGVAQPHGSSISSDVFSSGIVRSGTDFTVYTDAGMEGLDLAFYQRRSLYHTKDDSIPSLNGKAALWAMLEAALTSTKTLANQEASITGGGNPVYFDLLGSFMVVAKQSTYFTINLILLILGPIIVIALLALYTRLGDLSRVTNAWLRLPLALTISVISTLGFGKIILAINPHIVYSAWVSVLISTLSVAYLSLYLPLVFAQYLKPVHQPKSMALLQIYTLSWLFLVVYEVMLNGPGLGGLFFATFFNAASLLAVILDLGESFYVPRSSHTIEVRAIEHQADEPEAEESERVTEITPLLRDGALGVPAGKETGEEYQPLLWIVEFLLLVHTHGVLVLQAISLVFAALAQTISDGSPAATVYSGVAWGAVLLFLPVAPFIHKMHHNVALVLVILLTITVPYNLLAFPFSAQSPLKVFFQHRIDLDSGSETGTAHIAGLAPYTASLVVPELPSARATNVSCEKGNEKRPELVDCSWKGLIPKVARGKPSNWLSINTTRVSPGTAHIEVSGLDTRNCRLNFDQPISGLQVAGDENPLTGLNTKQARLWSRTWSRRFVLTVKWTGGGALQGRAACEWAELVPGRIPALDEALNFAPSWVQLTKADDGLVEVSKGFTI